MTTHRFDDIAVELEQLAQEIVAINAQPFEYLVERSSDAGSSSESIVMQAMVENLGISKAAQAQ